MAVLEAAQKHTDFILDFTSLISSGYYEERSHLREGGKISDEFDCWF